MKILVVNHSFNNYGGIINHTEYLIKGLKDIGHNVKFAFLKPQQYASAPSENSENRKEIGVGTGIQVDQEKGWYDNFYPYRDPYFFKKFIEDANNSDLVIWESIFGFKCKQNEGDTSWEPLITNINTKQVVIIHDGNLQKMYPWIIKYEKYFSAVACVHFSAYNSANVFSIPRALIFNPQYIDPASSITPFEEKENMIFSLQTFKRWKRVDDLIRAVPHYNKNNLNSIRTVVAGDGLERYYMTSETKCKYFASKEEDPDIFPELENKPIWKNAEEHGFEWIGFISEKERDNYLDKCKFLIDTSWSKTYSKKGSHFNRVVVEAMKKGVVPIATNLGMSDNEKGESPIFNPDRNYLMIPYNASPKEFAQKIKEFFNISKEEYNRIVNNNFSILHHFDYKNIAQQYIDLSNGVDTGFYNKLEKGDLSDEKIMAQSDKILIEFFGFKEGMTSSIKKNKFSGSIFGEK